MRDIKFRIWLDGRFIWGGSISHNSGDSYFVWDKEVWVITDQVIQQYTSLKDKHDIRIYEGDILQCPWGFGQNDCYYIGEVVFWKGAFKLSKGPETEYPELGPFDLYGDNDIPTRRYNWKDAEIIGNICQNPELL